MSALHTGQINECVARILKRSSINWLGCLARDQLPLTFDNIRRPFALIFNTHPASQPGEHWLAMYSNKVGQIEFFDSYGLPPSFYSLSDYNSQYIYSDRSIQSIGTNVCGHYCIIFIYLRSQNRSFEFTTNYLEHYLSDSSVVRLTLDLIHLSISEMNCTGQSCIIKHS